MPEWRGQPRWDEVNRTLEKQSPEIHHKDQGVAAGADQICNVRDAGWKALAAPESRLRVGQFRLVAEMEGPRHHPCLHLHLEFGISDVLFPALGRVADVLCAENGCLSVPARRGTEESNKRVSCSGRELLLLAEYLRGLTISQSLGGGVSAMTPGGPSRQYNTGGPYHLSFKSARELGRVRACM
jgi:hypothetical protein